MIEIIVRYHAEDIQAHYPDIPLSQAEFILQRIQRHLDNRVQELAHEAMQEMVANHIDDEEREP